MAAELSLAGQQVPQPSSPQSTRTTYGYDVKAKCKRDALGNYDCTGVAVPNVQSTLANSGAQAGEDIGSGLEAVGRGLGIAIKRKSKRKKYFAQCMSLNGYEKKALNKNDKSEQAAVISDSGLETTPPAGRQAASKTVDAIVGTYRIFYTSKLRGHESIIRFYPDNTVIGDTNSTKLRWALRDGTYRVDYFYRRWIYQYSVKRQEVYGEPDLLTTEIGGSSSGEFEALKLSDDPDFLMDHYVLGSNEGSGYKSSFYCFNVGRKNFPFQMQPALAKNYREEIPHFARNLVDCEKMCEAVLVHNYGSKGDKTCPQDRR